MFFGGTSFAGAPFADPGFNPNALALPTGSRLNVSTNTQLRIVADANLSVTGNRINITVGNVAVADLTVGVTGSRINEVTGDVIAKAGATTSVTGNADLILALAQLVHHN